MLIRRTKYLSDYEIDRERAKFYRQNSAIIVTDKDDKIANNVYSLDGYYEIDDHHKITVIIPVSYTHLTLPTIYSV